MKMKLLFSIVLTGLLIAAVHLPITFAEDYTTWGLPEGAKARLGKGRITGDIVYSPDGARLAVASSIGIWIYDAATGEELDLLIGHTGYVLSIAFSPDGLTLASASSDGTVLLWKIRSDGSLPVEPKGKQLTRWGFMKSTEVFQNYPNPFNPETWIPYQLAAPADVTLTIYASDGPVVRTLTLGQKPVGIYRSKSRAAHWDGKNQRGEPVASGVYFYTLTTDDFSATRKMLIRK